MYYYAYINADTSIVEGIYSLPSAINHPQYIQISSNDETLVGKYYDAETGSFLTVYYYAVINDKNVCVSIDYAYEAISDPTYILVDSYDESLIGLYWNGAAFVTAPISVIAVASTDTVNYKNQDKWLSTKLDEMDEAITGKAATVHAHTAADISGVVKTINGTAPDENGNITITVTGGGMTAAEILDAVKGVDGTGSGLDADTLDGVEASGFATADHTHTGYAAESHTHDGYATADSVASLNTALAGKADANHTHDGYATAESVTNLATTVAGKADSNHTHNGYATTAALNTLSNTVDGKADASHSHTQSDITGLASALAGKADTSHTHSGYASSSHSHSEYLSASGGTVSGNLNVTGILRVNGQQSVYDSGTMVTLSTNNRQTMIAGSAIYSKVQISVSSDERLKENINPVNADEMIDFIKGIDVKTFNYIGNETECIGAIAQQVQEANPEVAKYFVSENEDGYLSVKVADLVFPLIAAVQKLAREVEELKK